jgi:hypothetical protein
MDAGLNAGISSPDLLGRHVTNLSFKGTPPEDIAVFGGPLRSARDFKRNRRILCNRGVLSNFSSQDASELKSAAAIVPISCYRCSRNSDI